MNETGGDRGENRTHSNDFADRLFATNDPTMQESRGVKLSCVSSFKEDFMVYENLEKVSKLVDLNHHSKRFWRFA